jgi:hypothetical protein
MPKRRERREMKTKLLGVLVEPSVYEQVRVEAFRERCSVGEVVRRAVADYLGAKQTLRARGKKGAA